MPVSADLSIADVRDQSIAAAIPDLLRQCGINLESWQYTTAAVLVSRWHPHSDPAIPLIVGGVLPEDIQGLVSVLVRAYPSGHQLWFMASASLDQPIQSNLSAVGDSLPGIDPDTRYVLVIPPLAEECSLTQLPNILARLRGPGGCPWDREQTLESLRFQIVSEVHEVIEAIDLQDDDNLAEELGDLLLDTFFLINIGFEEGRFHLTDVLAEISRKMIRRHPHVFGDQRLTDSDSVLQNWDQIKQAEYRAKGKTRGPLDGIGQGLPALEGTRLLQTRAHKAGYEAEAHVSKILDKEDLDQELELGYLLWSQVAAAVANGQNPEDALRRFNALFKQSVGACSDLRNSSAATLTE